MIFGIFLYSTNKAQPINFTITNNSGTNTITCITASINISLSSSWLATVSYSCFNATTIQTGSNVTITSPGNYTIIASSGTISSTQTIAITINTTTPSSTLSPISQSINCVPHSLSEVTVTSAPSLNITHYFTTPVGGTLTTTVNPTYYTPSTTGTYTHVIIDNITGCSSSNTFIINSPFSNFPWTTLTSPQNFSVGCSGTAAVIFSPSTPTSVISLFTYSLINQNSLFPVPTGPLSSSPIQIANASGTWTYVVRDTNMCTLYVPLSIGMNTTAPLIESASFTNCQGTNTTIYPNMVSGISSSLTINYTYQWFTPASVQLTSSSLQYSVSTQSPGNYTVFVTDTANGCFQKAVVSVEFCAGVKEYLFVKNNFLLFPNPSNGIVNISGLNLTESICVKVYNSIGVLVHESVIFENNYSINITDLPSDTYFIRLLIGKQPFLLTSILKH